MDWISQQDAFAAWAPAGIMWSQWAKPVAFMNEERPAGNDTDVPALDVPALDSASALVVDLPGADAVAAGLQLADRGFVPVPVFNGTSGPAPVVDVAPITRALLAGALRLRGKGFSPEAAPAFLLDARRRGTTPVTPGRYDNRWVALPQDFPSGALLGSRGVRRATVLQRGSSLAPDVAHVLRRWQDQGIAVHVYDLTANRETAVQVAKPSGFRRAWYAAIVLLGLRRSNVGGFGGVVPEQTSSGGYG